MLKKQPFQPFRLVMSSGKAYEVRHPQMAFLSKTSLYVGVDVEDEIPADFRICSLLHVTTIEPVNAPSETKSNGST